MTISHVDVDSSNTPRQPEPSSGLIIDRDAREVMYDGGHIPLTRTEFDLLAFLEANPRRVFTPRQILTELWQSEFIDDTDSIEVYASRLRRKLGESAAQRHFIHTVRGVGYRFQPHVVTLIPPSYALFDASEVLQLVRPNGDEILGWRTQEVVGTRFNPSANSWMASAAAISVANWIAERAGLKGLSLDTDIKDRLGNRRRVTLQADFVMHDGRVQGLSAVV